MVIYESAKLYHGRPYRNPKYIHVGLFVHYKPKDFNNIVDDFYHFQFSFLRNVKREYKSRQSKEPRHPIYSFNNYAYKIEY